MLPVACGTLLGTLTLLQTVLSYNSSNLYSILVVDYDIYWRIYKLLFTRSLIGSLSSAKQRLIVVQGPWHIYKSICEAIWDFYAPLLLSKIWLFVFEKACPQKPALKDMLLFFIYLFVLPRTLDLATFNLQSTLYGKAIHNLMFHLIPLVSCRNF